MQRNLKIVLAVGLLVGGFIAAMAFRHDPKAREADGTVHPMPVTIRENAGPRFLTEIRPHRGDAPLDPSPTPSATVSNPDASSAPPPMDLSPFDRMQRVHVQPAPSAEDDWVSAAPASAAVDIVREDLDVPSADIVQSSPGRIHRVLDGDTLPALAAHYLGDASRQNEIFELNRALLDHPDLLPIGAELRIPDTAAGNQPGPEASLTP